MLAPEVPIAYLGLAIGNTAVSISSGMSAYEAFSSNHPIIGIMCSISAVASIFGTVFSINAYIYESLPAPVGNVGGGTVNTPYGTAIQSNSQEAMQVKGYVENGGMVYRGGTLNRSKITDAQFWAPESPLTHGYADKYGVDFSQMDYIIGGYVKEGTEFITRPAPGLGNNIGGVIEIVTPSNSVDIKYFYMIGGQ